LKRIRSKGKENPNRDSQRGKKRFGESIPEKEGLRM